MNKKPEKLVESECLAWLNRCGFSMHVVESKAVWSVQAKRYLKGNAIAGFPDLVGNDDKGRACFVELKAKGQRKSISVKQWEFLLDKIHKNCFGVCVDSVEILQEFYETWSSLDGDEAKEFLLQNLPRARKASS